MFHSRSLNPQVQSASMQSLLFTPLNLVLLLHGIDLQPVQGETSWSSVLRTRRYFFLCLLWLRLPFAFYGDCIIRTNLASFNYAAYYVITGLFQAVVFFSHDKMIQFVDVARDSITIRNQPLLTVLNCFFFFIIVANALITTLFVSHPSAIIARALFLPEDSSFSHVIGSFLLAFDLIIFNALMVPMSLYSVSLGIFYFSMRKLINQLDKAAEMGYEPAMLDTLGKMNKLFLAFERLFSFCPLIWSMVSLLDATCHVIFLIEETYKNGLVALGLALFQQILTISVFFAVSCVADKIRSHKDRIIHTYHSRSNSSREISNILMYSLNTTFDNKLSIWGMGDITRHFILTYLGTIVTFSVLFVQIRNGSLLDVKHINQVP